MYLICQFIYNIYSFFYGINYIFNFNRVINYPQIYIVLLQLC